MAWCLDESGVTLGKVRERGEEMWSPEARAAEEVEFPFTPRLRNVVGRAKQEARRDWIRTVWTRCTCSWAYWKSQRAARPGSCTAWVWIEPKPATLSCDYTASKI